MSKIILSLFIVILSCSAFVQASTSVACQLQDRAVSSCGQDNEPVCGLTSLFGETLTCPNACEACRQSVIVSYTPGKCNNNNVLPAEATTSQSVSTENPSGSPYCGAEDRHVVLCSDQHVPVCAYSLDLNCWNNYQNACQACQVEAITNYLTGFCYGKTC